MLEPMHIINAATDGMLCAHNVENWKPLTETPMPNSIVVVAQDQDAGAMLAQYSDGQFQGNDPIEGVVPLNAVTHWQYVTEVQVESVM